jgi:ABC-type sugar transport system ATPase subunit
MIYVTHDQIEAMTLADRIVVLRKGRVEQIDTPLGLYNRPQNLFVAGFIGAPNMNFFQTEAKAGRAAFPGGAGFGLTGEGRVTLGIRPQHLRLAQGDEPAIPATVHLAEALGAETVIHATAAGGEAVVTVLDGQPAITRGQEIRLAFDPAQVHAFGPDGQRLG